MEKRINCKKIYRSLHGRQTVPTKVTFFCQRYTKISETASAYGHTVLSLHYFSAPFRQHKHLPTSDSNEVINKCFPERFIQAEFQRLWTEGMHSYTSDTEKERKTNRQLCLAEFNKHLDSTLRNTAWFWGGHMYSQDWSLMVPSNVGQPMISRSSTSNGHTAKNKSTTQNQSDSSEYLLSKQH